MAEKMILDTEAAVMANFEFLADADIDMEEEEGDEEEQLYDSNTETKQNKVDSLKWKWVRTKMYLMLFNDRLWNIFSRRCS